MNNVHVKRRCVIACLGTSLFGASSLIAQTETVIIQTNYAGSNAHIIDPVTNEVVDTIEGVPKAHAVVNHPDGTYFYFATNISMSSTWSTSRHGKSSSRFRSWTDRTNS